MEAAMTAGGVGATGYHAVHLPEDPARAVVWHVVADYLAEWIPSQSHVLEIGAGYCCWINAVRAARRVAVDSWPDFPSHAGRGVETLVLDVSSDLGRLGTAAFDVVLASNVIEHFEPDAAALLIDGVAAALRPGGRLLVIQPNFRYAFREYFDDYTHRSIFTDLSLPNLLRSRGFQIDRLEPRFLPYSMRGARWPIAPWLVRTYLRSPIRPLAGQMLVIARKS
jgi:SAM-dependent methyltransferase